MTVSDCDTLSQYCLFSNAHHPLC